MSKIITQKYNLGAVITTNTSSYVIEKYYKKEYEENCKIRTRNIYSCRCLKDNYILPVDGINVIYGDNAHGKTNILECMYMFNGTKSFRMAKDSEMIGFDKEFCKLSLMFFSGGREQSAQIIITQNKKEAILNGIKKQYVTELAGSLCMVVFSPDHLSLIKEGPSERRKFIDNAISQIKPRYIKLLNQYNQTLNQRNALLKEINYKRELMETLSIWDEYLAGLGSEIVKERLIYLDKLKKKSHFFHNGLSNGKEDLSMIFEFSYDYNIYNENNDYDIKNIETSVIKDKILKKLQENTQEDLQNKFTSCGPHRDDLVIFINNKKTRNFASQGQQRSAVLSLKLAEAGILKDITGEYPIILLDDVLSELDSFRQEYLLNNLKEFQVFITCCDLASVLRLKNGKVFNVKSGVVKKQSV